MLFYISLLSLALVVVSESALLMVRAATNLRASAHLAADASASFSRLTREIRGALSVADAGSVFGIHPGVLVLETTDAVGVPKTMEFKSLDGTLYLFENGISSGALTGSSTALTSLIFRKVATARSTGVKIEMTLRNAIGAASSTESFYSTVVLRGSY